jgi:hypothetical protein
MYIKTGQMSNEMHFRMVYRQRFWPRKSISDEWESQAKSPADVAWLPPKGSVDSLQY